MIRRKGWVDGVPPDPPAARRNRNKAACDHGHPLAGANIYHYTRPNGRRERYCLQCRRDAKRRGTAQRQRTRPGDTGVG